MARINSPLFNAGSGKVGGVVLRNVQTAVGERAIDMSAYQPIVSNPQTVAQMRNRVKMGTASKLGAALTKNVGMQNLYTQSIGNKTQFTWYMKNFMREADSIEIVQGPDYPLGGIAGTGLVASGLSIATTPIRYTQGRLSFRQFDVSNLTYSVGLDFGTIELELNWSDVVEGIDKPTDNIVMWVIDVQTGNVFTYQIPNTTRGQGGVITVSTPEVPMLVQTESYKIGGFSFFRQNENGSFESQVSYPAFWVGNGDNTDILPPVDETAYFTSANVVEPPAPVWG